ncbi:hypothetical protein KUTeg_021418 [Tegillarca granosa]|uniref:G-protein coupled receptors family 1 profile domain-containing protein n=1 Tax=Tegillarca granosa TaxID=220873 RepID=A0ABQ9E368_TEGGR|nr:hypothetical protein KUTeg_021418 [Tegillarca granosa]
MYYNLSEYHNLSAEYYSNYTYDNIAAYDIDEAMAVQFVFYSIVIPIISCIGITVFNIPRLFATHSKFHKFENSNKTYFTIENTEFGESNFFFYVYSIWMYAFVIYIIPILSLLILSVPTIRQLLSMRSRIKHLSAQQTGEINLTVCIVLVAMFFVFCQTPGIFAQIREVFSKAFTIKLISISNTLFVFNSSVNFFIYTAAGSRFRYVLKKMFLPVTKWRHNRNSKHSGSNKSFDHYRFRMMTIDLSESMA